MTSLLLFFACTASPEGDSSAPPIEGLYDTADPEDGSCRFLDESGAIFACSELNGLGCETVEGASVTLEASAEPCPDGATATCGDDPDSLWSYYGAADGPLLGAWCEACSADPVPAGTCDSAVDSDGDGVASETDCDDGDSSVFPGAVETCDGVDQDCSGTADDGLEIINGACVEGGLICDSGYSATDDLCVAWRDPWIGDYTYTSECGGEPSEGGFAALSANGSEPTDLLGVINGETSFGITLQSADGGTAPDLGATVDRDPSTGDILLVAGDCSASFSPTE